MRTRYLYCVYLLCLSFSAFAASDNHVYMQSTSTYVNPHRGATVPAYNLTAEKRHTIESLSSKNTTLFDIGAVGITNTIGNNTLVGFSASRIRRVASKRKSGSDDPDFWDDPFADFEYTEDDDPGFWDDPFWNSEHTEEPDPGFWDDPYYQEEEAPIGNVSYLFVLLLSVAYVIFRRKEKI